jgi:hypothetical protein
LPRFGDTERKKKDRIYGIMQDYRGNVSQCNLKIVLILSSSPGRSYRASEAMKTRALLFLTGEAIWRLMNRVWGESEEEALIKQTG